MVGGERGGGVGRVEHAGDHRDEIERDKSLEDHGADTSSGFYRQYRYIHN